MNSYRKQLEGVHVGPERSELVEKEHREIEWLVDQLNVIFEKFRPFMSFR